MQTWTELSTFLRWLTCIVLFILLLTYSLLIDLQCIFVESADSVTSRQESAELNTSEDLTESEDTGKCLEKKWTNKK